MSLNVAVLERLKRGAAEVLLVRIAGAGLLFLMHVLMIRTVGVREYGVISYTLAIVTILSLVAPLGWSNTILRFVSGYCENRQWGLMAGILRRAHQITLVASITGAVALLGISCIPAFTSEEVLGIRFAAAMLPLTAFVLLRRKAFQALHQFKSVVAFDEVLLPVLVIAGMLLFSAMSAAEVLTIYLVVVSLVFVAGSTWLWRCLPLEARNAKPAHDTRTWMAVSVPVVLGEISFATINRIDQTVLGTMLGMEEVGFYAAAMRLALLNTFVLAAISTVAAPLLANAFMSGNRGLFKSLMMRAMTWSALAALPLTVVMLAWPGLLLGILGIKANEATELLRILAIGQFVYAALGPLGICLIMIGSERQYATSMATVAVLNILALLLLVPVMGTAGAAWASTVSFSILGGWQFTQFLRGTRRKDNAAGSGREP